MSQMKPCKSPAVAPRQESLPVQQLARSTPGTIELRLGPPAVVGATVDDATRTALRHEVVHQYLWQRCPQAARDRLFHEAMAVALSGEARQWRTDGYLSLPVAMDTLDAAIHRAVALGHRRLAQENTAERSELALG